MKETMRKLHEAMQLLKLAADAVEKDSSCLDQVHEEIATSLACAGRARRMLAERESEAA